MSSLSRLLKRGRFAHLRSAVAEEPKDTTEDEVEEERAAGDESEEGDAARARKAKKAKRAKKARKAEGRDDESDLDGDDLDEEEDEDGDEDEDEDGEEEEEDEDDAEACDEDEREGRARAMRRGRRIERRRCAMIFASKSGALRPDLAAEIAFGTKMSAARAVSLLDRAVAKLAAPRLAERMSAMGALPNPGPGGASQIDPGSPAAFAAAAIAAADKARGR